MLETFPKTCGLSPWSESLSLSSLSELSDEEPASSRPIALGVYWLKTIASTCREGRNPCASIAKRFASPTCNDSKKRLGTSKQRLSCRPLKLAHSLAGSDRSSLGNVNGLGRDDVLLFNTRSHDEKAQHLILHQYVQTCRIYL